MNPAIQRETYREQLLRMTRALANAQAEAVHADISPDSQPLGVKMFVDGNLDKRFEKLASGLEFVAPAFRKFDDLIVSYLKSTPLAAYDTGASDSEQMLVWLEQSHRLTARQQDYVSCQRARHAVEDAARADRLSYVRFHERWSVTSNLVEELPTGIVMLYLNPIRVWATFRTTALIGDDDELPARVVFFPIEGEISTATLDQRGQALLTELEHLQPLPFTSWAARCQHAESDELLETVRDLAAMGLLAVA